MENLLPGQTRLTHQHGLAFCGFEAWKLDDGCYAVRFTEYPSNKGRSVTNSIEELATFAASHLKIEGPEMLIAEHYVASRSLREETFDEVIFTWSNGIASNPVWSPRNELWWKRLLEEPVRQIKMPASLALGAEVMQISSIRSARGGRV